MANEELNSSQIQRYRLDLSYIGTSFHGWQSQPSGLTIQDTVEAALATTLRHQVRIKGAVRTDSGVHAENQVAVFATEKPFDADRWRRSLQGLLPAEIGIRSISPIDPEFHPILSAKGKAYRYRLWISGAANPYIAPYSWWVRQNIDIQKMELQAQKLIGRHDFSSFCAMDSSAKTRVREIFDIHFDRRGDLINVWISGNGFLKQMVRNIVGTLVEIGRGREGRDIETILSAKDRKAAGRTAPACGLALISIFYDDIVPIGQLLRKAESGYCCAITTEN